MNSSQISKKLLAWNIKLVKVKEPKKMWLVRVDSSTKNLAKFENLYQVYDYLEEVERSRGASIYTKK